MRSKANKPQLNFGNYIYVWTVFFLRGVTIHRTGPHRATPDRNGPVPSGK